MKLSKKTYSTNTLILHREPPAVINSPKIIPPFHKPCLKIRAQDHRSPKNSLPLLPLQNLSKDFQPIKSSRKNSSLKSPVSPSFTSTSKGPFSPKPLHPSILKNLNDFEKEEVKDYKKIYYSGVLKHKIRPSATGRNHGFDFDNGNYKLVSGDHLGYRYEIKNLLGKGSYGVVCECFDHKKKEPVAVKVLKSKKQFYLQGTVEVSILKAIKDNDPDDENNLVKLKFYFFFRNHICLVFPLLGSSLFDLMTTSKSEGFSVKQVKEYTKQILQGLAALNALSVIHCDIKPENILFTRNSSNCLKIIDFGSSCFLHEKLHTYVQSRFYRSPEIVLGVSYSGSIDVWSLGCLIYEMFTGEVLFPVENENDLIVMIVELIGMPPKEMLEKGCNKMAIFDGNKPGFLMGNGRIVQAKTRKLTVSDDLMLDLMFQCLEWDPEKRIKPEQAILHPWLTVRPKGKSISHFKTSPKHRTLKAKFN